MTKPKITIAIPVHEMVGEGARFLRHSLQVIQSQTFKDFDVVVSDNSSNDELKDVCAEFPDLDINYFKNPRRGMAPNTNAAIEASKGELIKILYLDDFLFGRGALQDISDNFKSRDHWLVTGCIHTRDGETFFDRHFPNYHNKIYTGANTIGSPSVLTIRNKGHLLFDESLTWVLDCDLYKRYRDRYGLPMQLGKINVVIRQGDHQVTNILPDDVKRKEVEYVIKKYE